MFEPSDSMDGFPPRIIDPTMRPVPPSAIESVDAEACNSWTESGIRSPTVSVARLAIPGKASSEFQKGCSAYKDKRYPLAEDHLRAAIAEYSDYAAAWVVLGQTLDGEHKRDDARKACSQASTLDPKYVAPYLCLAEFAATDDDWKRVSELSKQALAIDPVNNPYSLYYSASSNFHLLESGRRRNECARSRTARHLAPSSAASPLARSQICRERRTHILKARNFSCTEGGTERSADAPDTRSTLAALDSSW